MSLAPRKKLLTVADYHLMGEAGIFKQGERVELINGEIIEMAPIGSLHSGTVKAIIRLFTSRLGDRIVLGAQDSVYLNDLSEPEPDISILKPRSDMYRKSIPEPKDIFLLIEVANSSVDFDRNTKLPMYAAAGVPEFWLVNLQENTIEVYHSPGQNGYNFRETIAPNGSVTFKALNQTFEASEILYTP